MVEVRLMQRPQLGREGSVAVPKRKLKRNHNQWDNKDTMGGHQVASEDHQEASGRVNLEEAASMEVSLKVLFKITFQ